MKLAVSFSGGKTSAVMTKIIWDNRAKYDAVDICFANTGCEHQSTLDFIRDCSALHGWPVTWVEAVSSHEPGVGIRHRIVTYDTASRNGEPFENYIKVYGIPNAGSPQCTTRLKEEAMYAYRRDHLGWKAKDYWTAIGIRADEIDRMSSKAEEKRLVYPLVSGGWTKRMVAAEVERWGIKLDIPGEHYGNCTWCWKKSLRKLVTIAREQPSVFDFPARMEKLYSHINADNDEGRRVFFRKKRSAIDILALANDRSIESWSQDRQMHLFDQIGWDSELDRASGCSESCEIGADE